jgi:hydrogenase maturation protease
MEHALCAASPFLLDNPGVKVIVIGIGQSLRGDDGAGLAVVRLWQQAYPLTAGRVDVRVELVELPGTALLNLLEGAEVAILVDAVHTAEASGGAAPSGAMPGSVHILNEEQLAVFAAGSGSAHGWGVAETLSLGRQLMPDSLPGRVILVGIEIGQVNLGENLSPQVEAALPAIADRLEQLVQELLFFLNS